MITVDRQGDKIILTGWAGPKTPDMCRSIGGGSFKKKPQPHWQFPLSMITCRRTREVFGDKLVIGHALNVWAKAAKAREEELEALKSMEKPAAFSTLPQQAPALNAAMRPYQRAGIAFGSAVGTFGLFDQPGLGKTAQTIGAIIERGPVLRPTFHLVLAPKIAVETVWPGEVARWAPGVARAFPLTGTRQNRESALRDALEATPCHVFVLANIEMARDRTYGLHDIEWETVVLDESHRALVRNSVKTESQQRKGIVALKSRNRIALSGTPMRGKPKQLWSTLNWLRPDIYSSMWTFIGNYFETKADAYSSFVIGDLKAGAAERMAKDISSLVVRRTKEEVLPELPPKTYIGTNLDPRDANSPFGVWLTPSPKHLKQYADFCQTDTVADEGGEIDAIGTLAQYTRRKQLSNAIHTVVGGPAIKNEEWWSTEQAHATLMPTCDSAKYEYILQLAEDLGVREGEGRLVIASQFTRLINVFAAGFSTAGIPVHVLTGETKTPERQRIIADFQSDDPTARVFFLNTDAGGVAVTLDMADDLVILDESPVPDDQEQVEDRVHRASRMHNVSIRYLRTLGTQDEEIAWVAAARESVQKYILDGARGIEYAKQLYYTHQKESAHA